MPKLPQITPRTMIRILKKKGFIARTTKSSHLVFVHPDGRRTVIAVHNKPLAKGTLHGILQQTELTVNDLLRNR
jgi:predicted RNA binding protein YcfA (HicA-like mRNA interferase family)